MALGTKSLTNAPFVTIVIKGEIVELIILKILLNNAEDQRSVVLLTQVRRQFAYNDGWTELI